MNGVARPVDFLVVSRVAVQEGQQKQSTAEKNATIILNLQSASFSQLDNNIRSTFLLVSALGEILPPGQQRYDAKDRVKLTVIFNNGRQEYRLESQNAQIGYQDVLNQTQATLNR